MHCAMESYLPIRITYVYVISTLVSINIHIHIVASYIEDVWAYYINIFRHKSLNILTYTPVDF